jgi:hypothetical protein
MLAGTPLRQKITQKPRLKPGKSSAPTLERLLIKQQHTLLINYRMSNETTIDQMNEAIAVFDGWMVRPERIIYPHQTPFYYLKEGFTFRHIGDFDYHSNWSSLMPVIKKVRDMHTNLLLTVGGGMSGYIKAAGEMNRGLISCDINKAHSGVYKFLEWYNKQKEATNENTP